MSPSYCCDILEAHDTWHLFFSWERMLSGKACLGPWWCHLLVLQAQGSSLWFPFHLCLFGVSGRKGCSYLGEALFLAVLEEQEKAPTCVGTLQVSAFFFKFLILYGSMVASGLPRWLSG